MHKRTKALDISPGVKREVWERDGRACVLCGSPFAAPNAHYIARSHGGLGIPQNIVTLCAACHDRYDNSPERPYIHQELREYLRRKYTEWNEEALTYRKHRGEATCRENE